MTSVPHLLRVSPLLVSFGPAVGPSSPGPYSQTVPVLEECLAPAQGVPVGVLWEQGLTLVGEVLEARCWVGGQPGWEAAGFRG